MEKTRQKKAAGKLKVNLRQIARKAGLGASTVSRVLRGMNNVSPEARDKVIGLVEAVGYDPRRQLRSSRVARQRRVFINIPFGTLVQPSSSFFHQLYLLLANELTKAGFGMVTGEIDPGKKLDLDQLELCGALISLRPQDEPWIREAKKRFPDLRVCAVTYLMEGAQSVSPNDIRGAEDLARHLSEAGAREVCILEDTGNSSYRYRSAIFENTFRWLREGNQVYRRTCEDVVKPEVMREHFARWFPEGVILPKAFFCPSGWTAEVLYSWLEERKVSIPRDVRIVCFDRPADKSGALIPIPFIDFELRDLAKGCVFLLEQPFGPQRFQPDQILVETKLFLSRSSR